MSGIVSQWSGMRSRTERHTLHTWDEATMVCPLVGFFGQKTVWGMRKAGRRAGEGTAHGLWVGLWALLKCVWHLGNVHTRKSHSQGHYTVWSNLVRLLRCRPLATQWHLGLYHTHLWVCQRPWQHAHEGVAAGCGWVQVSWKKKPPKSENFWCAHTIFTSILCIWAVEWCELNIGAKKNLTDLLERRQRCTQACCFISSFWPCASRHHWCSWFPFTYPTSQNIDIDGHSRTCSCSKRQVTATQPDSPLTSIDSLCLTPQYL